jgi:multisubunit Na+/H+ antiporter MnhE subunit
MLIRVTGLFCWAFGVWVLLTWTFTLEQVLFGVAVSLAVALALAPLGNVAGPWRLLRPRALAGSAWLLIAAAGQVFLANLRLSRRIWDPRRPLSSGMVITVVAAVAAWGYLRIREPAPVRMLRALHNGSVNDYAAYATAGLLAVIAALTLI